MDLKGPLRRALFCAFYYYVRVSNRLLSNLLEQIKKSLWGLATEN